MRPSGTTAVDLPDMFADADPDRCRATVLAETVDDIYAGASRWLVTGADCGLARCPNHVARSPTQSNGLPGVVMPVCMDHLDRWPQIDPIAALRGGWRVVAMCCSSFMMEARWVGPDASTGSLTSHYIPSGSEREVLGDVMLEHGLITPGVAGMLAHGALPTCDLGYDVDLRAAAALGAAVAGDGAPALTYLSPPLDPLELREGAAKLIEFAAVNAERIPTNVLEALWSAAPQGSCLRTAGALVLPQRQDASALVHLDADLERTSRQAEGQILLLENLHGGVALVDRAAQFYKLRNAAR